MEASPTLLRELRQMLNTPEPAELGPEARAGTLSTAEIDGRLEAALKSERVSPAVRDLLRAALYLWHDHLDEAHTIVQNIENADGSLVHAIMHRREPDFGNAKYWFRRVGSHPSFLSLAVRASEYLEKAEQSDLHTRLLPNKTWDPFAFVDAVEDASEGTFKSKAPFLREVQKLEVEALVENLAHRL